MNALSCIFMSCAKHIKLGLEFNKAGFSFCHYVQDGDMGELEDEVAARARGTADISAFGNVLQEFLDEQVSLWLNGKVQTWQRPARVLG